MRNFVKQAFSYDDAARVMKSWSDRGWIPMTYEEINAKRQSNPKQLLAIYWSYVNTWKKENKVNKKAQLRTFAKREQIVSLPLCQRFECQRTAFAYNYCQAHFQDFVTKCYPEATQRQIEAYLDTLSPRSLARHAVIVEPVKPVTPSGAQTPQTMKAPSEPHPNQSDSKDNTKQKKTPKKPDAKEPNQQQEVQQVTEQVVKQLNDALSNLKGFNKLGYGAPVKRKKENKDKDRSTKKDVLNLTRDHGYESAAHTNFPGAGGQSYFTPYTAAIEAMKLLRKQAQIWAKDGMPEKDIKKRLQPYIDRLKKTKKKTKKKTDQALPLNQSPEKNPNLLTPQI